MDPCGVGSPALKRYATREFQLSDRGVLNRPNFDLETNWEAFLVQSRTMEPTTRISDKSRRKLNRRIALGIIVGLIAIAGAGIGLLALGSWHRERFDFQKHMVWIEPGTFQMGGPRSETGSAVDNTAFEVTIRDGFHIGKFEVTQSIYQRLMGVNPSHFGGLRAVRHHPLAMIMGEDLPVESVSWQDAMEFCRRLTESERKSGRLPEGHVYSLPTEAQWEYAARAGSGNSYCFGNSENTLGDYAWYAKNCGKKPQPVGLKRPNAWGLHDMHGNVWEWCRDWYANYPTSPVKDPTGPASGNKRVNRGGGWYGNADNSKSAYRNLDPPDYRKPGLGFRIACVPE